jgi:hypothetical protein
MKSETGVFLNYSCPRGTKTTEERPTVEATLGKLLGPAHAMVPEDGGATPFAWIVIDGSLFPVAAEPSVLGDYIKMAAQTAQTPFQFVPFPVILTTNTERWQRSGFRFPSEFLLPLSRVHELPQRLVALKRLHGPEGSSPFNLAEFRDFVAGNFREALGLDHSHHGTTSNLQNAIIDLKQLAEKVRSGSQTAEEGKDDKILAAWRQGDAGEIVAFPRAWPRIISAERAAGGNGLYSVLFPDRASRLAGDEEGVIHRISNEAGKLKLPAADSKAAAGRILDELLPELHRSFPRWLGHGLASLTATKLIGLVVDDQVPELLDRLKATRIHSDFKGRPLDDLIHFCSPFADGSKEKNYVESLLAFLQRKNPTGGICPRCIDFVLLDLSFTAHKDRAAGSGVARGGWEDPLGWRMLPILRRWFPDIPIIVHSWFGSSTQIRLAYERGADWFLQKDDDHKLPAHLHHLLEQPDWQREWSAHSDVDFDLPAERKVAPHHKYLWWKSTKDLPGDCIRVRPLGGGISSSITAKVWKRVDGRFDRLPPVIVKIDHPFAMGMEFERYRRFIGPYLGNRAGRIHAPPARAGREHAAIAYTCAGASQGLSTGSTRTEIVPLTRLLQANLPTLSSGVLPHGRYERLMRNLLEETLPRIHNYRPETDPDYPNPVFGEFEQALNGYILRFPATKTVALDKPLLSADEGQCRPLLLAGPDDDNTSMDACDRSDSGCGLFTRVRIEGPLARHYCRFRRLRRFQIVRLQDELSPAANEGWPVVDNDAWATLKRFAGNLPDGSGQPAAMLTAAAQYLRESGGQHLRNLRTGIIHGDLNLGNIMVERALGGEPSPVTDEPWLIDFAWTRRDAIAIDFAQLEMDILIRLSGPHVFRTTSEFDAFRDSYLETPWKMPASVEESPRGAFLWSLMRQVREAADAAEIDPVAYAHVRLAALLITAKLRLKPLSYGTERQVDRFAAALTLSWLKHAHELLNNR